jgi:hypothetical protein
MCLVVSVFDGLEALQFSAEFPTPNAAQNFIEWRIEELLDNGAKYLVVSEAETRTETKYRADGIADCIFLDLDWRQALLANAA